MASVLLLHVRMVLIYNLCSQLHSENPSLSFSPRVFRGQCSYVGAVILSARLVGADLYSILFYSRIVLCDGVAIHPAFHKPLGCVYFMYLD